jgi:uncharacterized damage-inducible protein DinB
MRSVTVFVLLLSATFSRAQQPQLATNTQDSMNIPNSINFIWKDVEKDFISLAEAMPEEKWNFRPSGTGFKGVRTFGEQVKHVACANEAWAKQIDGEKPPEHCDTGGPNPAKSKAEILAYLRESFTRVGATIQQSNRDNLLEPAPGPYWAANRISGLIAVVWHLSDHYGQLVEYLRMNGIVPPASR